MTVDACDLLAHYVERHNAAAMRRDTPPDSMFEPEAEVEIEGVHLSELRRRAMVSDFRDNELVLWKVGALGDDVAFANYAWRHNPRLGGLIRMQRCGDRIRRLTLRPGYSRIFSLLVDR